MNIDSPDDEKFVGHHAIFKQSGIIGENFINFDKTTFQKPFIIALPLKTQDGDGSPVRAIAIEQ